MSRTSSSLALVAEWLADAVGEGEIFTKQSLRAALPQFEQVDRRMRDLRAHGWRIDTNREDAQLLPNELRLVQIGPFPGTLHFARVSSRRISPKERLAAMSSAGFRCSQCGIQLGEPDGSESGSAQLRVKRIDDELLVSCGLCASAVSERVRSDTGILASRLAEMSTQEVLEFRARIVEGRMTTPVESALALSVGLPVGSVISEAEAALRRIANP